MEELQAFGAVAFVLLLLCGMLYLMRQRGLASFQRVAGRAGLPRMMESVERIPLGPQQTLHLVRVGNRNYLVALGPGACQITLVEKEQQV